MKYKNIQVPSLFLVICLLGFPQISETIYTPSLPDLARSLGIGMDCAEFTLTLYFVGFAFGVFFFGRLADGMGRRHSMLIGILIYILGSLECSISNSIEVLLLGRFIQAFGAAAGSVVTQTILRDLYTGSQRNQVFSVVSGALGFSPAIGPVIGGAVDQFFSWRANFYVLSMMGVCIGIASLIYLPETRPVLTEEEKRKPAFFKLLKEMALDPKLICYALLIGGCNGIIFSYYAEAPFIFIELLKLTPSQYGLLGLVVAFSFFLSPVLSIRLNRLRSTESVVRFGAGTTGLGSFLLSGTCGFLPHYGEGVTFWMILFVSLLAIFTGVGIMIPNCLSQALVKYQDSLGTAGSIFGFTYYWIIAGFTGLMGILHNGTAMAMPSYFCVIALGMVLVCRFFLR